MKFPAYPTDRVSIEALPARLARLVKAKPRTTLQLRELTGYSVEAVRVRLHRLASDGLIHSVEVRKSLGFEYWWHPGEGPIKASVPAPEPKVAKRDPLVAALFGPAKPAGKLLGAGSVLGGEG
ncbi:hypothetical protein [Pseudoduganella chitinolytica]|uniref:Uncharacterized protein n=1 Tax=Pseudoduganella chitinolytica TaxID=34070 RepID=A0ABY8BGD4_9BURK|nr:hypothetical protein [Pseudoduganella chitinolytica]WEF34885.1 hypothetical protein PX653_09035 [Pseudoduganella chitinolytica]